jgi:hypothetical protein
MRSTKKTATDDAFKFDSQSAALTDKQHKAVRNWSKTGTKEQLKCLIASAEEKRALAKMVLQEKQGEVEQLQLIVDIQARMMRDDALKEHMHECTQNSNMHNIMLRCVTVGMNISDAGFEILMQAITPAIMDPVFVAQSNKYVPRQDQDSVHMNVTAGDSGALTSSSGSNSDASLTSSGGKQDP